MNDYHTKKKYDLFFLFLVKLYALERFFTDDL